MALPPRVLVFSSIKRSGRCEFGGDSVRKAHCRALAHSRGAGTPRAGGGWGGPGPVLAAPPPASARLGSRGEGAHGPDGCQGACGFEPRTGLPPDLGQTRAGQDLSESPDFHGVGDLLPLDLLSPMAVRLSDPPSTYPPASGPSTKADFTRMRSGRRGAAGDRLRGARLTAPESAGSGRAGSDLFCAAGTHSGARYR